MRRCKTKSYFGNDGQSLKKLKIIKGQPSENNVVAKSPGNHKMIELSSIAEAESQQAEPVLNSEKDMIRVNDISIDLASR